MSLSSISIKRPVLAIVMNLTLVLFGIIGFKFLGIREYPSIDPPIISVRASYPGANSDVIESQITEPLEKALNGIDGVKNISSTSNQGSSSITIEFNLNKNLEEAANDVRDKVSQAARSLPRDMESLPIVSKEDADSQAILMMTIQSDIRSALDLGDFAENTIAPRLQTIPGVSSVQIMGQKRYAMRIWIDPAKLASYRLTALDIRNALDRENVELPTGKLTGDATEITVKTIGNLTSEEQFNNLIIQSTADNIVKLGDLGTVVLGPENEETSLRVSGKGMVGLGIIPQPGANYLDISNEFYKRYAELEKDLPKDFTLNIASDSTIFVRKSVKEVSETIFISLILVIIVIYLFFRDWSIALRPLIDIPVSLITTFFIMYLFGFSINVLTLLAIVLATGLVVDDGIVVTENIFKKLEEGYSPFDAAIKGSNEIFVAVISISVTLAAVFLPVIFLEGFVGRLFREFGVVIAAAVLVSAFVSLSLTPMLNAFLMKGGVGKKSKFYRLTEPFFVGMISSYGESLSVFMKRRWIAYPILIVCIGLIALFWVTIQKETAPYDDRSSVSINVTGPEGASYTYTDNLIQRLSQMVDDSIPEQQINLTMSGGFGGRGGSGSGMLRIRLVEPEAREKSQQEILDRLTRITRRYSEARMSVSQQPTISVGRRGGSPISYIIQAPNFEKLREKLPLFVEEAANDPTFTTSDANLKFSSPEINISLDRDKAKNLGVSVMDVAQTLQFALSGQRFAYFLMNGKQYPVIGQYDRQDRNDPSDITSLFVRNNKGELVQLDNLIKIEERSSPPQLYHNNQFISATVSASLAPGKSIGDGIEAMDRIADKVLDDSFSTALSGESRDFKESSSNTLFAFGLALLLVYLILAAQFESFVDPMIIILTVPMAVAGAFLSLWLFGQTWNIFSQIGTIMLIGLVTKNGILIVEFANQLKERGKSVQVAITEAAEARLRPILMTSITIALGALPIALALGGAAKSRMSMGIVIIGGTLFSLVLTLFVIPAIYSMWSRDIKHDPEMKIEESKINKELELDRV